MLTTNLDARKVPQTDKGIETRLLTTSVTRQRLLRLAMRGMHASEAAKIVGCNAMTARSHYSDPDFRRAVLARVDSAFSDTDAGFIERTKSLTERLEEQAMASFEQLRAMLDEEDIGKNLRYRIHTQFLDRHAESAPVSRSQISFDSSQLKVAALAAHEMDNVTPIRKKG